MISISQINLFPKGLTKYCDIYQHTKTKIITSNVDISG